MAARTTSTRRAVAGAVRTRLKTALTAEDYVGSAALRNRADPSLAQQGLRHSPARHLRSPDGASFLRRGQRDLTTSSTPSSSTSAVTWSLTYLDPLQDWSLARQKERAPADALGSTADCAQEGTLCIQ